MIFIVSQSQRLNFQNTMMHQEKEGGNKAKQQPESQRIEMTKFIYGRSSSFKASEDIGLVPLANIEILVRS